tara:strand:- start:100744 stop:101340 length:597 start_codon:yes stop_codon:yes gene_type:complete
MKRILITGFEPFSDIKNNPSETLVHDLYQQLKNQKKVDVQKMILPVDYLKAESDLSKIDFANYDFVFQFGVASKRTKVCLERVALNWIESSIPDNSGAHPNCRPIDDTLESSKINTLDLQKLAARLNSEFPESVEVSLSTGAYLCNFVYFKTLSKTSKCLFVHVPSSLVNEGRDWSRTTDTYRNTLAQIAFRIIEFTL